MKSNGFSIEHDCLVCRSEPSTRQLGHRAFTLIELLVVVVTLAVMVCLVFPALCGTRTRVGSTQCASRLRAIVNAMTIYANDYHDLFPPNPDDGTTTPGYVWCGGQVGIGGADEFNPDLVRDPKRSLLAPYLAFNDAVFRCTADWRTGNYDGAGLYPDSPLKGKKLPAARSLSMNNAVGTVDPAYSTGFGHSGVPSLPVNGPWLTGVYGANSAARGPWWTYGKISQLVAPSPAQLFVLSEESPYSVNDATLAVSAGAPRWLDYPSTLHNFGCALAFGDGHTELHRWSEPSTEFNSSFSSSPLTNDLRDWSWLAVRTSALR